MNGTEITRVVAATAALAAVPAAGAVWCAGTARHAAAGLAQPDAALADGVLAAGAAALALVCTWLAVAAVAGGVQALRHLHARPAPAAAPSRGTHPGRPARRHWVLVPAFSAAVLLLAGTGAASAAAAPAPAAAATAGQVSGPAATGTGGPLAAGVPDTPAGAATEVAHADPAPAPPTVPGWTPSVSALPDATARLVVGAVDTAAAPSGTRVVLAGDSLWGIAAAHLGAGATDSEVAAEWPRWWQANRDVVGDDPDVLLPGQQLRVPS